MMSQRRSYWKTIIASSLIAAGGIAALGICVAMAWPHRSTWLPWGWLALGGLAATLALTIGWAALVAAGGLVGLRRDALEERGVPYAPRRPREWSPGPVVRAARRVMRLFRRLSRAGSASLDLRAGELVEVRSLPEILATLDERGTLDGLPFMPEMSAFCGKRLRVFRRVDKLNDWVGRTGLRRMHRTVLLEQLRCDGGYHGGCQAHCHLRWKEAWLRRERPAGEAGGSARTGAAVSTPARGGLSDADLHRLASRVDESGETRWMCQVTELAAGTTPLAWKDPRHYLRDFVRGNVRFGPLLTGISVLLFNWVQRKRGGVCSPSYAVMEGTASPHEVLDLQPGEAVRVRTKRDIEKTLNSASRNRGLWFDRELLRFCGGQYRVLARVDRLIEERTGKMVRLSNPCIVLDGVTASGEYLGFCAQNEAIFWREIWLRRAPAGSPSGA